MERAEPQLHQHRVIGHPAGSGAQMQSPHISLSRIALLVVLGLSTAGCQIAGDIFQAGMWVGVLMVVLVLGGIAFVASKFRSGPR
jgi:energy-converting hydrogenase Eha subunit H